MGNYITNNWIYQTSQNKQSTIKLESLDDLVNETDKEFFINVIEIKNKTEETLIEPSKVETLNRVCKEIKNELNNKIEETLNERLDELNNKIEETLVEPSKEIIIKEKNNYTKKMRIKKKSTNF